MHSHCYHSRHFSPSSKLHLRHSRAIWEGSLMLKPVIYISYDVIHCAPTASREPTPLELACVANKHMQMCTEGQWFISKHG